LDKSTWHIIPAYHSVRFNDLISGPIDIVYTNSIPIVAICYKSDCEKGARKLSGKALKFQYFFQITSEVTIMIKRIVKQLIRPIIMPNLEFVTS
jgi:hypothetical protein